MAEEGVEDAEVEEGVDEANGMGPREEEEGVEDWDSHCPTLIIILGDMLGNFFFPAIW